MEHHKPHPQAAFEGYYSKFRLPSGSCLALIVCAVPDAPQRPYMLSVTYVSKDSRRHWQREYWPSSIEYVVTGPRSFEMKVADHGTIKCSDTGDVFDFRAADVTFSANTIADTRQPWSTSDPEANPAGLLAYAPLPIQWHVQTLCTQVDFELAITSKEGELSLADSDRAGRGHVHMEKNWAKTFPEKYIWVQAWDEARQRGLTIAGGEALPGFEAYMLTYTSRAKSGVGRTVTMSPPWTCSLFGISPFCHSAISYKDRTLSLDVSNLFTRIRVESSAPPDTFFGLTAPLKDGHSSNFCGESFAATHKIVVWERQWPFSAWSVVAEDVFTDGSLEYGGTYYDDRGEQGKKKL